MKVLLGMSGGIDSSMSALFLLEQGFEVVGVSFRFLDNDSHLQDAVKLSETLKIPHFVLDARKEFQEKIIDYFTAEYLAGRTPFPCAKCNNELKWRLIFEQAKKLGCEKVSMGHYVNITEENGFLFVTEGKDKDKDQSFFLWGLSQLQLSKIIFPLGNHTKSDVKQLAETHGFYSLKEKKESTGACFCSGDYRPFLRSQIKNPEKYFFKGNFVDEKGNVLGVHNGYPLFTVGQRRGFSLQLNKAMFVKEIRPFSNEVILAPLKSMYKTEFFVKNYKLVNPELFSADFDTITRIRYRKQNTLSKIKILNDSILKVELKEPLESIAPGQTAVFYRNGKVLGGGFIE
ncbi:tRNA-specific 2-thiouridylase MnmA 2 [uncultured Paludibacter sp.]|nr:tRNA-specific 2-thiouridylase MnmA 2 [uncultured Paludibacter sp.]